MLQWKEVEQYISVQTNFIMLLGMSYLAMCNQKFFNNDWYLYKNNIHVKVCTSA